VRLPNLENRAFVLLVVLTTIVFFWMVRHFLMPVFWAAVLAILFRPVFKYWKLKVKRDAIAAAITTVIATIVVIVPMALLTAAVAQQAISIYQSVIAGDIDLLAPIDYIERSLPRVAEIMEGSGVDIENLRSTVEEAAITSSRFIATQALALGQMTLTMLALFLLTLYFLFFFIRDGSRIVELAIRALPLGDERERRLFVKFAQVSRAALKGTLVIAAIQGALGGIMFAVVGIQGAVFWGVVMGVLSLLPIVGAFMVWGPAAIFFFATGTVWKGVFLIAGGSMVVGLMDNILRPILVGRETKMPDYIVLLATLGGLTMFGISGFVIGPIIAALFLVLWEMFTEEYTPVESSRPPEPG
jgi:predicted PurR-regulated permease PerM